jgi:hypothetical protein
MATAFQPNAFQNNAFQIVSSTVNWILAGVTRGLHGQPLGLCNVFVYDSVTDGFMGSGTSDASGNYTVTLSSSGNNLFAVAYLAGTPDLAGTTVNTLVASSST